MSRFVSRSAALALLMVALVAPSAKAVDYDFSVSPNPPNEDQTTTFTVVPAPAPGVNVAWDVTAEQGFERTGPVATHVYPEPGPARVRMRVTGDGPQQTVTKNFLVNGAPEIDFTFFPADPLAGEGVAFAADATDAEGDDVTLKWDFGDGEDAGGATATHSYAAAGTYAVVLTATDAHGAVATRSRDVTVAADPGPSAAFEWSPEAPFAGDVAFFSSTATPSQGSITEIDWDFDGDGDFDDATGPSVPWTFAFPGEHLVQLRVMQSNGLQSVAFATVAVAERPPPLPAPPLPPDPGPGDFVETGPGPLPTEPVAPSTLPVRMSPFPVVRIAGVVLPRGALVRILSVRAPRGAQVRVRCRGRGCPAGSAARTSATRLVRFRRFERRLPAGVTLEIFVRQAGKIGKYTRFLIRAGKPPARIDRCLVPGRSRPVRC
jgi:PKD repeat protein